MKRGGGVGEEETYQRREVGRKDLRQRKILSDNLAHALRQERRVERIEVTLGGDQYVFGRIFRRWFSDR